MTSVYWQRILGHPGLCGCSGSWRMSFHRFSESLWEDHDLGADLGNTACPRDEMDFGVRRGLKAKMWDSVMEIGNEVPGPGEDRVETDS